MENLYGLAALIAWNPGVAFSLLIAGALLRRWKLQLPAGFTAVLVGTAVGLSHGDGLRQVAPPPDCAALDPFLTALWLALLTFAAEWPPATAADPDRLPPAPRIPWTQKLAPWSRVLRETLLTVILFLTAVWRPALCGVLCLLLLGYGLAVLGLQGIAFARRLRVARRLQAAAQAGAWCAQESLRPDPVERALVGRRHRRYALALFALALLVTGLAYIHVIPGATWVQTRIGLAMQNVVQRCGAVPPRGTDTVGYQLAMEADCLQHIAPLPYLWWRLHCAVSQAEFGIDPYPTRRGYFMYTYISPVDDSPQAYTVWVPYTYDPDKPLPLLVWLHGHIGFRPYQGIWIPTDLWTDRAIVVAPQARGSLDYTGIQMNEVARAMQDVEQRYSIDRSRVYLAGHSMGGTGSWYLATQWPTQIAAIAPSSPNLSPWAWGYQPPTGDPLHDDLAVRLQMNEAAIGHVAALGNMPFLASHSDDDRVVPVENSRMMVAALAALHPGAPPPVPQIYRESQYQGVGHGLSIPPERRLNWLLQFQLPPATPPPPPADPTQPPVPAYGPICRAFDEPFVLIVPDGLRPWADCQPRDNHELALQQIAREVIAFQKFWVERYQWRPRVLSAAAYLRSRDPRRADWHPILLGGPDVNLATAMLLQGDGPLSAWRLPPGFDAREEHLTAAGTTARGPAILYAIAPPADGPVLEAFYRQTPPPPFAVVISASDGSGYFQCLRRYGIQFGSYALRNRIWFDYALSDAGSFDHTRLIHTYGFYTPAGEPDPGNPTRAYHGDLAARVNTLGSLWPTTADRFARFPGDLRAGPPRKLEDPDLAGESAAANDAPVDRPAADHRDRPPFRYALYEHLPCRVDSDTPLSFNAHAKGEPLRLGSDPARRGQDGKWVLHGVSLGALGAVAGPAQAAWTLPPGRWRITGRVGPDFAVYPPLVFAALDRLPRTGARSASATRRPIAGYRLYVDTREVWASVQPLTAIPLFQRPRPPAGELPAAALQLEYAFDLELPAGKVLTLETFPLRGNPWELPPTVWADLQLERID